MSSATVGQYRNLTSVQERLIRSRFSLEHPSSKEAVYAFCLALAEEIGVDVRAVRRFVRCQGCGTRIVSKLRARKGSVRRPLHLRRQHANAIVASF